MPAIIALIGGVLGKFLTDRFLAFVALKALLYALFILVLPIVLKNVLTWFMSQMMTLINSNIQSGSTLEAFTMQLNGVGAYLGGMLQLPYCLSIILSAIALRITLNFIPFVR